MNHYQLISFDVKGHRAKLCCFNQSPSNLVEYNEALKALTNE